MPTRLIVRLLVFWSDAARVSVPSTYRKLSAAEVRRFPLLTMQHRHTGVGSPRLADVRGLTHLTIEIELPPHDSDTQRSPPSVSATDLVKLNAQSLQSVFIQGDVRWTCPLTELRTITLIEAVDLLSFPSILDSRNLIAMSIEALDASIRQMVTALAAAPDACPQLTDLKLICDDDDVTPACMTSDMEVIANFVKGKQNLRRLHVAFHSEVRTSERPLLEVLEKLPNLQVLGLGVIADPLTAADLQLLDDKLPTRLTNLLLYTEFEESELSKEEIANVVSTFCVFGAILPIFCSAV